jgi:hypothetical protein
LFTRINTRINLAVRMELPETTDLASASLDDDDRMDAIASACDVVLEHVVRQSPLYPPPPNAPRFPLAHAQG